jgi:ribosomal protein L11 methyltransferase
LGKWPAVDVTPAGDPDLTLAIVDDFAPTAVEPSDNSLRIFFANPATRDAACAVLSAARYRVEPVDVDDEDWARRSQENLNPVTVDRITVAPPWRASSLTCSPQPPTSNLQPLVVVIQPSMGFGTGHHATTRLCLHALQSLDLAGRFVLDIGTGSGVLAIAAMRLGAARAVGIDHDADAIHAATENLALNDGVQSVEFQIADLSAAHLPAADVVTANLTGAVLIRSAVRLLDLVRPEGTLIVSGLLEDERDDVARAFGDAGSVVWEQHEDGWVGLAMKRS